MTVFLLKFSIPYLLTVSVSYAWSHCTSNQVSCLSQDLPPLALCIDRDSLCFDGTDCRADVLQNISLQCSSIPPNLVCDNETETFPLEVICNGTAQCSDNSDEIDLLCQGIPQLPFLTSNTGQGTPVVDIQSPFNSTLEGPIPTSQSAGFPFGSSIQTNFSVSPSGYISFGTGAAVYFNSPTHFPSSSLSYIVAPFWSQLDNETTGGVRCDMYNESNGSETILQDVANFIERMKPDITSFNATWMLVCEWSNITNVKASTQRNTFEGLVITDGVATSFAVFTYHCNSLQWPTDSDAGIPVTIGFQGDDADFFAVHPLSYQDEINASELACANSPTSSWSNVVYQLAPKPAHYTSICIIKDTKGYVVGESSKTVCKTDLSVIKAQWFRKGNNTVVSNSAELILIISDKDNNTVYCCRTTTVQGPQEASFMLIVSQPHQSVSPSPTHTVSGNSDTLFSVATPMVSDANLPSRPDLKNNEEHILIGSVIVGVVVILVALLTLISIYCRKNKCKWKGSNNNFNGSAKDAERVGEAWSMGMSDLETGLFATLTGRGNPSFSPQVLSAHRERLEVPFSALDLQDRLGNGTFGAVFKGALRNLAYPHRQPKPCVVKLLKSTATKIERDALLSQLVLMLHVEPHPHLLKLLGCCTTGDKIALVVEYCHLGNLREFLIRNRRKFQQVSSRCPSNVTIGTPSSFCSRTPFSSSLDTEEICLVEQAATCLSELANGGRECGRRVYKDKDPEEEDDIELSLHTLLYFGRQITLGMEHLAQKKIVHRNLAARNVFVSRDWKLKISDFGTYSDDLYSDERSGKIPLRWMALETILDRQFSIMSDMWSFGVVLWEIVTLGTFPYQEFSNSEVLEKLQTGYRMPKPENCPQHLYELMLSCWREEPVARPQSFKKARQHLDQVISTTEEAEEYLLLVSGELMPDDR